MSLSSLRSKRRRSLGRIRNLEVIPEESSWTPKSSLKSLVSKPSSSKLSRHPQLHISHKPRIRIHKFTLELISEFCCPGTLLTLCLVSKDWNRVCSSRQVWLKVFRQASPVLQDCNPSSDCSLKSLFISLFYSRIMRERIVSCISDSGISAFQDDLDMSQSIASDILHLSLQDCHRLLSNLKRWHRASMRIDSQFDYRYSLENMDDYSIAILNTKSLESQLVIFDAESSAICSSAELAQDDVEIVQSYFADYFNSTAPQEPSIHLQTIFARRCRMTQSPAVCWDEEMWSWRNIMSNLSSNLVKYEILSQHSIQFLESELQRLGSLCNVCSMSSKSLRASLSTFSSLIVTPVNDGTVSLVFNQVRNNLERLRFRICCHYPYEINVKSDVKDVWKTIAQDVHACGHSKPFRVTKNSPNIETSPFSLTSSKSSYAFKVIDLVEHPYLSNKVLRDLRLPQLSPCLFFKLLFLSAHTPVSDFHVNHVNHPMDLRNNIKTMLDRAKNCSSVY